MLWIFKLYLQDRRTIAVTSDSNWSLHSAVDSFPSWYSSHLFLLRRCNYAWISAGRVAPRRPSYRIYSRVVSRSCPLHLPRLATPLQAAYVSVRESHASHRATPSSPCADTHGWLAADSGSSLGTALGSSSVAPEVSEGWRIATESAGDQLSLECTMLLRLHFQRVDRRMSWKELLHAAIKHIRVN